MDQKLLKLVEELTTSGEPQLNPEKMKELKKICKSSEEQLSCAYRLLKTQLTQDHAEVRLSAFQIVDELFTRSHQFRVLLVSDFQEFLELTLGTNHEQPLPPPREAAQRLRQAALRAVEGWNERFGEAYKKLALGYHFLKHTKKVDFQDVNGRTLAERQQEEQKQRHLDRIYRERAKQAEREMEEMSAEVGCCLTEVENCFRLLVPLDFDPCPEASFLDEGPPGSLSSDWEVPHWSSTPDAPDEPCCSKDLPASAYHPGATGAGEGPPQAATGDPLEDEEQPCCSKDLPASAQHSGAAGAGEGCQAAVEDVPQDECSREQFVRSHGLGSHKYSLDVELPLDGLKVQENDDNLAVLHAARDAIKLIQNKFLPAVCSWVQRFTRAGTHGGHLRCAIDLKAKLELALRKYEELHVQPEWGPRSKTEAPGDEEDEDDDEDFVEVPEKEGYEPHIPAHLRAEYGLEPKAPLQALEKDAAAQGSQARKRTRRDEEASDPTSAAAQLWRPHDCLPPVLPSSVRAPLGPEEAQKLAEERARAPVVPFGVDLCYWGQEQPVTGKILRSSADERQETWYTGRSESQHRFWKPREVEEEVDSADVPAVFQSRRITFAGKFEPVQHRCRALRPDGRLCARQDRLKCPFHGRIIPRDDEGRPLDPEDRTREQQQPPHKQSRPDWQDPEFMRDVEAATGADLGSSRYSQKGKGKRKKHPNLTDLRERANTSRARLRKKVFAKAAVRRVVTAMNQVDRKKHEKFANQFNYALN
ncbi:UV-stimulated scaffold protein A isoform X3 [Marmota marmota marmota]|uniref:UV-stimulated scaffold protein A isoform X3 n=1 Tax=Marmota marmota marmota TaxID=9994 RepID=UPI0007626B42|nr:UV-stimulated scaffold protein A isoform X3 [Marmota marmota marmota]